MTSVEKTEDQIRNEFIDHVRGIVKAWNNMDDKTCEEKINGAVFSVLAAIDGCAVGVPAFVLAPCPHENDKPYHIANNEDYYPENHNSDVKCDIAGELHSLFYSKK